MIPALLRQEVRALLRARRTRLAAGIVLYAVLGAPFLLAKPPPHVAEAAAEWFSGDPAFALFLFIWTDLALNKMAAILGVVLAGGIVREDQTRGLLPLLWAKPIGKAEYYLVKLAAAAIVFTLLLGGAALLVPRRLTAMLTSLVLLMLLVGTAFLGFYNPAWAGWAAVNPFYQAVWLLGQLDALTLAAVLRPLAILLVVHAVTVAFGALAVRRVEA